MLRKSRGVRVVLIGLALVALTQSRNLAQAPDRTVTSEGSEHDFDFLLGRWEFNAESKLPGAPPAYPGRWTAERTGHAALLEDDFIVVDDQGVRRYLGVTIRAFDINTQHWTTAFVVPPAATWSLGTAWREGNEIAEGPVDATKGTRARFSDIASDRFTWTMDKSTDGGKTWVTMVRVRAHRLPPAQSPQE